MNAEIVVSIAVVTGIVLVINQIGRILRNSMLHRTVREAITRDSTITPSLMEKLDEQEPRGGEGDERNGLILLAFAAALFCYGLIQSDADALRDIWGVALFPLFVGGALFVRARLLKRAETKR